MDHFNEVVVFLVDLYFGLDKHKVFVCCGLSVVSCRKSRSVYHLLPVAKAPLSFVGSPLSDVASLSRE